VPAGAGAWSTNSDYNALLASQGTLADCSLTVVPTDTNGDGRNDVYDVTLTVHSYSPTSASGSGIGIQGLQLAVEFTVEFTSTIVEQLRGVVYVAASSPSAGARVYVDGAMRFVQSGGPLRYQATSPRTTYNTAALGLGASGPVNSFEGVLRPYLDRNETVLFEPWATVWSPGPAEVFTAVVRVHVPTMAVRYRPSFWELAKYAWVQYVAVWLLVYLVLGSIRAWILRNQLLPSRVSWDYVPAVKRD
jgi:transmembrane protein 231